MFIALVRKEEVAACGLKLGPAVHIENLVKRFGDFVAVDNVSLDVAQGRNLRIPRTQRRRQIDHHSHSVRPACADLRVAPRWRLRCRDAIRRDQRNIGYMSQKFSLYDDLDGGGKHRFLRRHLRRSAEKLRRERRITCCRWPASKTSANDHDRLLSGGWKQRLALGCAMLHEPPILFLDEPTTGVDPIARRNFWDLIYQLSAAGHTIFVTTHYMDEAEYCHRIALMYGGRVIALGSPAELKTSLGEGTLLNLESSDLLDSMTALEGKPGILRCGGVRRRTARQGGRRRRRRPRIRAALDARESRSTALEPITPSMEDVFVSLIEQEEEKRRMNFRRTRAMPARKCCTSCAIRAAWPRPRCSPLMMLLLFGYALSLDVDRIPTMIYDLDSIPQSRDLIADFAARAISRSSKRCTATGPSSRPSTRARCLLGVVIPHDYSRKTSGLGKTAQVQLLLDGSDSNTASIALGYAESMVQTYSQTSSRRARADGGRQFVHGRVDARTCASGTTPIWNRETSSCRD